MRTTGLFTTHSHEVICGSGKTAQLVFFGDVHWDSPLHARDEWIAFLDRARGLENPYFIGLGDYLDSTSTTERECLGSISARMHDTFQTDIAALQMAKVEAFAKEIEFMRGRLVGLVNGNHYFDFPDGTNTDQQLCRLLGCKYLGVSSFVSLSLRITKTSCTTLDAWLHHGAGAGRMLGSSLNRVAQMAEYADADIYCMGDDHAKMVVQGQPRFYMVNDAHGGASMRTRHPWMIRSGSFLKAYVPGKSSYNVDAARGPRAIGHVELHITPRRYAAEQSRPLEIHGWS